MPDEGGKLGADVFATVPKERTFYVCSEGCRASFHGEKKERPPQKEILRRISHDLLRTTACVGDHVFLLDDRTPGHYVEEGYGVVIALKFDVEQDCALLEVKPHVSNRVVSVCSDGMRTAKAGQRRVPPSKRPSSLEEVSSSKRRPLTDISLMGNKMEKMVLNQSVLKRRVAASRVDAASAVVARANALDANFDLHRQIEELTSKLPASSIQQQQV
jgi:hypothetical protein